MTQVIIADDHEVFRYGLRKLLEEHQIQVVAEAATAQELLSLVEKTPCDLVITDLSMPGEGTQETGLGGLEAIRFLRARFPGVRVVVLSMHRDKAFIRKILAEEVDAYLLKDDVFEEIIRGIRRVMQGQKVYSSALLASITQEYNSLQEAQVRLSLLTPREKEVLILLARGMSNREMAQSMGISVRTVETHRAHVMEKLAFENVQEAVRFAVELNLV